MVDLRGYVEGLILDRIGRAVAAIQVDGEDAGTDNSGPACGDDVDLHAEKLQLGGVQAEGFEPGPADAVPDEIGAYGESATTSGEPFYSEDHKNAREVPQHLVEKQGVEKGACRQPVREGWAVRVDLQAPTGRVVGVPYSSWLK